jgi:uncharacterized membrane protein
MTLFITGLVLFLGVHSISIVNASWRDGAVARMGMASWQAVYSLASLAGFVLLVYGYGMARQHSVVLYVPPVWLHHLALLLLIFVFPLLFATYLPGRIKAATKHPMLVATKTWALAHLLANGSLVDVILFGAFLAWAVADRISLKRRAPVPVPGAPSGKFNDVIAVLLGLGLYAAFLFGVHTWLIGVSPLAK